ncbi:MAG TPA: DUF5906 domain-containing protein [Verrucomicrobiae bacterium]
MSNRKLPVSAYADIMKAKLPLFFCLANKWFVYKGGVWRPADKGQFRPQVHKELLPEQETSYMAHAVLNTLEGRGQVAPESLKSFAVMEDEGTVLLNCRNGLLRVTGADVQLQSHSPDYRFTRQLAAAFDQDATFQDFGDVLCYALPDEEDQQLLMLFAGYTLLPHCRLHSCLICHGLGGTGKSTLWEGIAGTLGRDLVLNISLRQLCDGKGYSVPRVRFTALNLGNEAPSGELGESDILKSLICGEPVEVRRIYGQPETLQGYPTKFVFLGNHLPRFKSATGAELRRLRFLQFDRKPKHIDTNLPARLASEKDGIFTNVMIPALQCLLRCPVMPEGGVASRAIKSRFAEENDPMEAFLATGCDLGSEFLVLKEELHQAFLAWAAGRDISSSLDTEEHFFRALRARVSGLQDKRPTINGKRPHCLKGIRLKGVQAVQVNP